MMKVVKEAKEKQRTVTLRLPESVMVQVDKVADKNNLSRQSLIAAILKQVLNDKNYFLKVAE